MMERLSKVVLGIKRRGRGRGFSSLSVNHPVHPGLQTFLSGLLDVYRCA